MATLTDVNGDDTVETKSVGNSANGTDLASTTEINIDDGINNANATAVVPGATAVTFTAPDFLASNMKFGPGATLTAVQP